MKTLFEIEPAYAAALRAAGLDSFDALMNLRGGPPASKHRHRETVPVEIAVDGQPRKFFLKRVFWVPPKHSFWPLIRGKPNISQPRNEWNVLAKLCELGIPAMQRVAFGEQRAIGRPVRALILVEAVTMSHSLEELLVPGFPKPQVVCARTRSRLFVEIGKALGRLQANSFVWPDIHAKHILAQPTGRNWNVRLIDVERMRVGHRMDKDGRIIDIKNSDLIRLRESLLPLRLSFRDYLHFVSGYSREYAAIRGFARKQLSWYMKPRDWFEIGEQFPRWDSRLILARAQQFERIPGGRIDSQYSLKLRELALGTLDEVFAFHAANPLNKPGLKSYRSRAEFSMIDDTDHPKRFYLKRYECPPIRERLRHISESNPKRSAAWRERHFIKRLAEIGVPTMRLIAYGEEMNGIIEKRSFLITEEVAGESLERIVARIHKGGQAPPPPFERREIIRQLALLVRMIHWRGFYHRDLYLSHVFLCRNPDGNPVLHLIDLARMIESPWRTQRWKIKDLAAVEYSAPSPLITRADRIRFLKTYLDPGLLISREALRRTLRYHIGPVRDRARRMVTHDMRRKNSDSN